MHAIAHGTHHQYHSAMEQGMPIEGHPNMFASDAIGRIYTVHPNKKLMLHQIVQCMMHSTSYKEKYSTTLKHWPK